MNLKRSMLLASGLLALSSACALDAGEFAGAIPSQDSVTINAPEAAAGALTLGERSEYYTMTRDISRDVNGLVIGVLHLIEDIVRQPATSVDGDVATWGPGSGDGLDPNVYRLVVTKRAEQVFDYALEFRKKGAGSDAPFTALVTGQSDKSSGKNDGVGSLVLSLDAIKAAEESECGAGALAVAYDTRADGVSAPHKLTVDFQGFVDCDNGGVTPVDATYYYDRLADGSGNFQFTFSGDIHEGARLPVVLEDLVIRSRWTASGPGRSDVKITGGDLEVAEVTASECWDASFSVTFATLEPVIIDPSRVQGEVSACPAGMEEASYAVEL